MFQKVRTQKEGIFMRENWIRGIRLKAHTCVSKSLKVVLSGVPRKDPRQVYVSHRP